MSDHIPTLADVCSAIAEGSIVATLDGTMYQINALELRRYLNKSRPLPAIGLTLRILPLPRPLGPFFCAICSAMQEISGCIKGK